MKIVEIHTYNLGSVPNGKLSLVNEWTGEVENCVLLTGVNGCGKSTLLRAIAMMWEALGYWLEKPNDLRPPFINGDGNIAIIFSDVTEITGREHQYIGLVYGHKKWYSEQEFNFENIIWIGMLYDGYEKLMLSLADSTTDILIPDKIREEISQYIDLPSEFIPDTAWFNYWADKFKLSKISADYSFPNMMYLDAEERRWIKPRKNIGEYVSDDFKQYWLTQYHVSEEWQGQLEQTLINLKLLNEPRFNQVVGSLNQFLSDKAIQVQPTQINDAIRLVVKSKTGNYEHGLDDLSSGEKQVLIMLFLMLRWLQKGGIVLIDEPDLYLHPSLVQGFLATLELEAGKLGAQLIITSHSDDVWRRYENIGVRIDMSGGVYDVR